MRRLFFIFFGLILILFAAGAIVFGLKTPEMPIKEVHKVISIPKAQQQSRLPAVPTVPSVSVPTSSTLGMSSLSNNASETTNKSSFSATTPSVATPLPASPPIIIPYQNQNAITQPVINSASPPTTIPSIPSSGNVLGNALNQNTNSR